MMNNLDVVKGLKPERLWYHFAKISEIPRGSKNEDAVMAYIKDFAKANNLEYREDSVGNLVLVKGATAGMENVPGVVLQGHTDMVCEKNKDTDHDFEKDPILFERDGDFIKAKGTTLGADNGIGFCAALAVLEADDISHGPLEALFTIDEETGMTGAFNLGGDFLTHRIMLNMDSEEDGALYVGCAGGKDTVGVFTKATVAADQSKNAFLIEVAGLKGGHSGLDIQKYLGNAIRLLGRFLKDLGTVHGYDIATISGGSKRNAIPREAEVVILTSAAKADVEKIVRRNEAIFKTELEAQDPGVKLILKDASKPAEVLTEELKNTIVTAIFTIPHGLTTMSQAIEDLVETSTNLATVEDKGSVITIGTSQRSSIESAKVDLSARVAAHFEILGATAETGKDYPGWAPNLNSKILNVASAAMAKVNNVKPEVKAIHAGLECGIIGEKFAGMDMISFGPTIHGAHSPDEKVSVPAVEKFWTYLLDMLKNVN
jgi:dipeptidase D